MFGGCYPNPDSLQKSRGFFPIVFTPGVGTISFQKMSTRRRFFLESGFYHIYNRGNRKSKIFLDERDYLRFLERAGIYKNKCEVEILCYCLMPNHFHFLIRQEMNLSISRLILKVCTGYSKYFNRNYNRVGSLFQDQFKSVHVKTNEQLLWLSAYIHSNPSVAKMKIKNQDYPYSSYKDYYNNEEGIVKKSMIMSQFTSGKDYGQFVSEAERSIIEKREMRYDPDLLIDEEFEDIL